jgi:hypothetical protein
MKKHSCVLAILLTSLVAMALGGCAGPAPAGQTHPPPSQTAATPAATTYKDPFSYCASVGTIDAPDARYTGKPAPEAVIKGYLKAAGLNYQTEYSEMYQRMTIWRCMNGQVLACNFGANLPCDSKADTNKTPTQAMADFCKENPGSDFIPMSVTGHETIYSWHCIKEAPELLDQISQVDAAGYLANIWYTVQPGP